MLELGSGRVPQENADSNRPLCLCHQDKGWTTPGQLLVVVYVDALLLAGRSQEAMEKVKTQLCKRFRMKDLGPLYHFLGMEIARSSETGDVWFGQRQYTEALLIRHGMSDSRAVGTPAESGSKLIKLSEEEETVDPKEYQAVVGGLLYLSTKTRPDIAYAVGNVAI